jgi:flagellar biosynthesis/type III secretory pathway protein FliH
MDVFDRMPWAAKNSVFERMAEIAEVARLGHDERIQYEADLKSYRDTMAVMHGQFLQGEEKGKQQGFEQGLEQGLEQGMKQGMKQGIEQGSRQASYAIARNLKSLGIPAASIVEATGLTAEEVGSL